MHRRRHIFIIRRAWPSRRPTVPRRRRARVPPGGRLPPTHHRRRRHDMHTLGATTVGRKSLVHAVQSHNCCSTDRARVRLPYLSSPAGAAAAHRFSVYCKYPHSCRRRVPCTVCGFRSGFSTHPSATPPPDRFVRFLSIRREQRASTTTIIIIIIAIAQVFIEYRTVAVIRRVRKK